MKQPSMGAVAAEANVATSTVSRFLAGNLRVAPETESRIREAIDRLGYRHMVARDPLGVGERHEPRLVIIVVSDLGNAYYAAFAEHSARGLEAAGYSPVTLSIVANAIDPLAGVRALLGAGVIGAISIGGAQTAELRDLLELRGVPLITVEEEPQARASAGVDLDNYSGARQVITYLTRLGHSEIAFISGPRDLAPVAARRRGYEDGLRAAGIEIAHQFDLEGECSEDFGFAALTQLLSFEGERPTAVFVAADEIAVGVLNAASQIQLSVPGELSVVGFDDIPAASHVTPRLTTVHTPLAKLAEAATSSLLSALAAGRAEGGPVVVPVTLVVRESTAALT